jgi:elongator complex protein 1
LQPIFTAQFYYIKMNACLLSNLETVVGLTSNLRLYLNEKTFSKECTSFSLFQTFLVFVNSTSGLMHEMFIYDLNRALPKPANQINGDAPTLASLEDDSNFNVRAVERGSRIVTIHSTKTVIQLPRGNLEGIYPRFIMLKEVI